jgi:hypothetical protein
VQTKHPFRNVLLNLICILLKFTHVIDGYSKYGKVIVKDENGEETTFHILLEEVKK